MECSFTYDSSTYTYLVDSVATRVIATGEQRRLISGDMDQNLHDLELRISIKGVFEQVGANDKSANQLWLDLLGGAEVSLSVDGATGFMVVPDLAHSPKYIETSKGVYKETVDLRFISKQVYQDGDDVVEEVAGLRPHFGS